MLFSFDFCVSDDKQSPVENLGQVVFGERIRPSHYELTFMKNVTCQNVCTKTYTGGDGESEDKLDKLREGIRLNYQHHWIVGLYIYFILLTIFIVKGITTLIDSLFGILNFVCVITCGCQFDIFHCDTCHTFLTRICKQFDVNLLPTI